MKPMTKRMLLAYAAGFGTPLFLLVALALVASGSDAPGAAALAGAGRFEMAESKVFASGDASAPMPSAPPPMEERAPSRKLMKQKGTYGSPGGLGLRGSGAGGGGKDQRLEGGLLDGMVDEAESTLSQDVASLEEGGAASRSWFPESFLFEPLVTTDSSGAATVTTRVPDRLTTWRVLALAHARNGAQAGAVSEFLGTLPSYVEPVVPVSLYSGDELRLPVRVVNTTAKAIQEPLTVSVSGGRLTSAAAARVDVPADGSFTQRVTVVADRAGNLVVKAGLGRTDAVERSVPVKPRGTRVETHFGGTLAAPRMAALTLPDDVTSDGARLALSVYPGALSLLRSELTAASSRGGDEADLYALLLAGRAPRLLRALGEEADHDALRQLSLLAAQRAFVIARGADPLRAASLAEAASAHPELPMLARLSESMGERAASSQRPDGTFGGGAGWTLQRVLAATAEGVAALNAAAGKGARSEQRAQLARLKASGAFERNLARMTSEEGDGYTAALALASGAVTGTVAEALREKVRTSLEVRADGSRVLTVPAGIVRADGLSPSEVEATAAAVLALEGDDKAPWRADLGAALLSGYRPGRGWGDGHANTICLRAALALFSDKVPDAVEITLSDGDVVLAQGKLDAKARKEVFTLVASLPAEPKTRMLTVRAEPPLAGLGYTLVAESWRPDGPALREDGLELELQVPEKLVVGQAASLELRAVAPSTPRGFTVRAALPAGAQPETQSLEQLVVRGVVSGYEVEPGLVTLRVPQLEAGKTFGASFRVVPTLGGNLHVPPAAMELDGRTVATTAAMRWRIE